MKGQSDLICPTFLEGIANKGMSWKDYVNMFGKNWKEKEAHFLVPSISFPPQICKTILVHFS